MPAIRPCFGNGQAALDQNVGQGVFVTGNAGDFVFGQGVHDVPGTGAPDDMQAFLEPPEACAFFIGEPVSGFDQAPHGIEQVFFNRHAHGRIDRVGVRFQVALHAFAIRRHHQFIQFGTAIQTMDGFQHRLHDVGAGSQEVSS